VLKVNVKCPVLREGGGGIPGFSLIQAFSDFCALGTAAELRQNFHSSVKCI
jgi:hypothetical protein